MSLLTNDRLRILERFGGTESQELASEVLRLRELLRLVVSNGPPESGDSEGHYSTYRCCYKVAYTEEHRPNCWWVRIRDSIDCAPVEKP